MKIPSESIHKAGHNGWGQSRIGQLTDGNSPRMHEIFDSPSKFRECRSSTLLATLRDARKISGQDSKIRLFWRILKRSPSGYSAMRFLRQPWIRSAKSLVRSGTRIPEYRSVSSSEATQNASTSGRYWSTFTGLTPLAKAIGCLPAPT